MTINEIIDNKEVLKPIYCAFPWCTEMLENGMLKAKREYLGDHEVNDTVRISFLEGPMVIEGELYNIYEYKIVSKVAYEDGEYYHCELIGRVCTK